VPGWWRAFLRIREDENTFPGTGQDLLIKNRESRISTKMMGFFGMRTKVIRFL